VLLAITDYNEQFECYGERSSMKYSSQNSKALKIPSPIEKEDNHPDVQEQIIRGKSRKTEKLQIV